MQRLSAFLALCGALPACHRSPTDTFELVPPTRLAAVTDQLADLAADVELVDDDGVPTERVALDRGSDGLSFSGFIPAKPGTYTAEVIFTGVVTGESSRTFLGRWVSDQFAITRGDSADVTFSSPLDPIGRPSDGGDADGDGLGNIDEIIWGADRSLADSDGDGLDDGEDCDPGDAARTFTIATGGSIEDCDADGVLRIDLPWGDGRDCDDRNASIFPGATDTCDDGVDQDCSESTCPADDQQGPTISGVTPTRGAAIGCHAQMTATVTDPAGVSTVVMAFRDPAAPTQDWDTPAPMSAQGGGLYSTDKLGKPDLFRYWFENGRWDFEIRATDGVGNTSIYSSHAVMQLDLPTITISTLPAVITEAVEVTVQASAPAGIQSVSIFATPYDQSLGDALRGNERLVWSTGGSGGTFTLDPSGWPVDSYVLYPVVVDAIFNELKPEQEFSVQGDGPNGTANPDYSCLFDAPGWLPVHTFRNDSGTSTPPPGFEPATMRTHFDEAVTEAASIDASAELVEIRGWGIQPNGQIDLSAFGIGNFKKWWYTFFNFTDDRRIEVIWWAAEESCSSPTSCAAQPEVVVTESDPFGYSFDPFANSATLPDSDAMVSAYTASAGCPALTGSEDDDILYQSNEPFTADDVVLITASGGPTWKGTAAPSPVELFTCE